MTVSGGKEIFDMPVSRGTVEFLKNDDFGREIVAWINANLNVPALWVDISAYRLGQEIEAPNFFFAAGVNAALEDLKIKEYRAPNPEDVLAIARARALPNFASHYFGVFIATKGGEHIKNIMALMRQTGLRDEELPAAISGLKAKKNERQPYGIRLDWYEKTEMVLAPALKSGQMPMHGQLTASNTQPLEKILAERRPNPPQAEELFLFPNSAGMQGLRQIGNHSLYSRDSGPVRNYQDRAVLIKER